MTNVRDNSDEKNYKTLQLVELLEMIGRVANKVYKRSTGSLYDKIYKVLERLFEKINVIPNVAVEEVAYESFSDNDY